MENLKVILCILKLPVILILPTLNSIFIVIHRDVEREEILFCPKFFKKYDFVLDMKFIRHTYSFFKITVINENGKTYLF